MEGVTADAADDTLVEEREELMIPPSGGNSTLREAHFLKPLVGKDQLLPPAPTSLLAAKPNSQNFQKWVLNGAKANPTEKWKLWVQNMKPKYQEVWKKSGIYQAILASTYSFPKDKMLILGLAEFWCCDTKTFVFPWGEVTITLEDIVHLGCFSVLGSSITTPFDDECVDVFNCLKSNMKNVKSAYGGCVTPSMWMDCLMNSGVDVEHEAFLACWLSKVVFGHTQVAIHDLNVAIHLSRGDRMALAPIVLASIYRDMRVLHNAMVRSVEPESRNAFRFTTWHYDLVQMWVWERFEELRPKPNVIDRGAPRSARWNGVTKLNDIDVRMALNNANISFLWRPYAMIQSNSLFSNLYKDNEQWVVVESDAVESFARCIRASDLAGLGYVEQYLPYRVAMQFGLDQDIPPLVLNHALGSYDMPIRGAKLYIPPRYFESDASSRYVDWWRGFLAVNEKISSFVSCGQKSNTESLATRASLSGCVKQRPENDLTSAQLKSRSAKSDDVDSDAVLNSYDDVEEDSLTIAQLLHRSRNMNDVGDELVMNTVTSKLMALAICPEATKRLTRRSEPMEPSLPSSDKSKKRKFSTERLTEVEEDAVETRNLKSTNESLEMSMHSMPSDTGDKRKSSIERQTEVEEVAVVTRNLNLTNEPLEMSEHSMPSDLGKKMKCSNEKQAGIEEYAIAISPEDNIINLEEESCEESQQPGLMARICRLEMIFDQIKAAKSGASSRRIPEK